MVEESRTELANEVVQAYLALGDATRLAALPSWITADLTLSQLKAVVLLEHHSTLIISELAELLGMGNPAASILVQQLVEQGFVQRSEDEKDRRRTYVRPTARGVALLAGRREQIRANLLRWLGQLGDDELNGLECGLGALMRVVQAEQPGEPGYARVEKTQMSESRNASAGAASAAGARRPPERAVGNAPGRCAGRKVITGG